MSLRAGSGHVKNAGAQYRIEPRGEGRFAVSGALTLETAASALAAGDRLCSAAASVEIDLSGVDAADSAGLAVLLEWVRGAKLHGRRLRLHSIPPMLAAMSGICDVEAVLRAAEA